MRRRIWPRVVIASLILLPALAFGLWYWSVSSLFHDMAERTWYDPISHPVPHSDQVFEIREYAGFRFAGAEFYLIAKDGTESYLGEITTNEHTPFQRGEYHLTWQNSGVIVHYQFSGTGSPYGKQAYFLFDTTSDPGTADENSSG